MSADELKRYLVFGIWYLASWLLANAHSHCLAQWCCCMRIQIRAGSHWVAAHFFWPSTKSQVPA